MKEEYITTGAIQRKADELLHEINVWIRQKPLNFDISKSSLLILDMQDYFLDSNSHAHIPSMKAIIPGLESLIEAFLVVKRPVILSQHLNDDSNAAMMKNWWHGMIREADPLNRIISELRKYQLPVITKPLYDAFYKTDLENRLNTTGTEHVIITGVMTHLCCETTARSAFMRGFEVYFPVDGTATYNEAFHRATLLNLAHGFAAIPRVADILERMGSR